MNNAWGVGVLAVLVIQAVLLGRRAVDMVTEPSRAAAYAEAETKARGISWPLESTGGNDRGAYFFVYANPKDRTERVELCIARDGGGFSVEFLQGDESKWPRKETASH